MGTSSLPPSTPNRGICLHLFALAPVLLLILVMGIGLISHQAFVNGSPVLSQFLFDAELLAGSNPPNSFREAAHRVNFQSTIFIQILVIIVSVGFAAGIFSTNLRWKGRRFHGWLYVAAFILLGAMLVIFLSQRDVHSRLNVQLFDQTMRLDPAMSVNGYSLLLSKIAISTTCFWAAFLLAGAGCAVSYRVLRTRKLSAIQLRRIDRTQQSILVCAAALLITQVLNTRAWEVWTVGYIPEALNTDAQALADAIVLGVGIFGSAALAAIYFPSRAITVSRIRVNAYLAVGKRDPHAVETWIKEQGLQTSLMGNIGKFAIILGPAMTGGIFEALTKVS